MQIKSNTDDLTEFQLLIDLLAADNEEDIKDIILKVPPYRYDQLFQQIRWHRTGLMLRGKMNRNLTLLPKKFVANLNKLNARSINKGLNTIRVLKSLNNKLTMAGIKFLVFKGVVLSAQLYDSPLTRDAKDIDILIDPKDLIRTHQILLELEYRQHTPALIPGSTEFNRYMVNQKDAVYISSCHTSEIEIHWRLDKNPQTLPVEFEDLWQRSHEIKANGLCLRTFNSMDNYLYLAAHGGISMWGRLKWLHDWKTIISNDKKMDWQKLKQRAEKLNLSRMVMLAMLLTEELFVTRPPPPFDKMTPEWQIRIVAALVKYYLPKNRYPPQWMRIIARLLLKSGLRYKFAYIGIIIRTIFVDSQVMLKGRP